MTREEYNAMSEQKIQMREKRESERLKKINAELAAHKMAYRVKDWKATLLHSQGFQAASPLHGAKAAKTHF